MDEEGAFLKYVISAWTMDFTAANGAVSHPRGMHNGERDEWYLSHAGGSGVLLPYDDGRLGFLLMLPKEGAQLSDYLSGWDGTTIKNLPGRQGEAAGVPYRSQV